jgi:protein TonB
MRDTIMSMAEQREPFGGPMTGSLLLHVGLVGAVFALVFVNTRIHNEWGVNGPQGAIQANLVNSAPSIPLPSIAPPTPNVLATEQPSPAPAPPTKETIPITPPDAIPLASHKPKLKPAEKQQPASPQRTQPATQGEVWRGGVDESGARDEHFADAQRRSGAGAGGRFCGAVPVVRG